MLPLQHLMKSIILSGQALWPASTAMVKQDNDLVAVNDMDILPTRIHSSLVAPTARRSSPDHTVLNSMIMQRDVEGARPLASRYARSFKEQYAIDLRFSNRTPQSASSFTLAIHAAAAAQLWAVIAICGHHFSKWTSA